MNQYLFLPAITPPPHPGLIGSPRMCGQSVGQLSASEPIASDHERQQLPPHRDFWYAVGAFKHVIDVIASADGVQQR